MNNHSLRWNVLEKKKVKDIVAVLLKNRGIKLPKGKKEFFNPIEPEKLKLKDLGIKFPAIDKVVQRIKKALKTKEKVIVYGDYDADGICGTAILWEALYALGLNVLPYIPERFSEGYGLNVETISKLKSQSSNLGLIITVDHGIVANKKVDTASKLGIDVIITDHHLPGKAKPKSLATIHTMSIGGAAIAWVLAREIGKKLKIKNYQLKIANSLELAAIGTIADQITLTGPNRSFAKYGLKALNRTKRSGLLALFEEAAIKPGTIGPYEIGFMIAPRLNATGRLTHAIDSLRLLCVKDKARARQLALLLGRTNTQRQKIVNEVVLHAKEKLKEEPKEGIIVLAHESYHEGVIGLAAAKLVEEFYRPAIILSKKGEISKASARSIAGFNIVEAIRKLEDLYLEGGGHPMAAGFSIETVKIEKFTRRINEVAAPILTDEILSRSLRIDLNLHFNQLNQGLIDIIQSFQPTGLGNPTPTFATRKVNVLDARVVGRDNSHLKLKLEEGGVVFDAIAFGLGEYRLRLSPDKKIDIAYTLEENFFNGYKALQLKIKDIKIG